MLTLVDKLLAVHDALTGAEVPHAFGGAVALAYCTDDPRGTRDLDVNVFAPAGAPEAVLAALPAGVEVPPATADLVREHGQVRLWWDDTPVDLFFDYAPLHVQAAQGVRVVPFAGREVPVLGAVELVLFKALFDRPKDWVDIASVLEAGAVDVDRVDRGLTGLLGPDDQRTLRWRSLRR